MKLEQLFNINYGQREYHSKENLDNGKTLLISSQGGDNGCYGFFDIEVKFKLPFITVPSTGSIGEAFVQLYPCCVDDNCLVLIPKEEYSLEYLFYIATVIRHHKWRFMYGRQITPERLGRVEVLDVGKFKAKLEFKEISKQLTPIKQEIKDIEYNHKRRNFLLLELFNITSGEYHSINNLKVGKVPLISCSDNDNGISGFYDIPNNKIHKHCLTVTYDGRPLTTKFHNYKFSAYDNVGVLIPKFNIKKTTLLFICLILNIERWRYGYGRKCYKQKLEKLSIKLPVNKDNEVDEAYIEKIMKNRDIFGYFRN